MKNMTENQEQAALFEWAKLSEWKHPELKLLHAIPNGGLRDARTAAVLQRTGVKPGVPDICLPVPKGGYGALYIELKRLQGGAVSANQRVWINRLNANGNKAVVCKGWVAAKNEIEKYLEGNDHVGNETVR
jgi:hypothetical protein